MNRRGEVTVMEGGRWKMSRPDPSARDAVTSRVCEMNRKVVDDAPVWYACYGSNLSLARFRVYLEGGRRSEGAKPDPPCAAGAAISGDRPLMINRRLYFAGASASWNGGAVAFVEMSPTEPAPTYGRMFLLTLGQLRHVIGRENGGASATLATNNLIGNVTVSKGWYSELLYLGSSDGVPIVTLTAATDAIAKATRRSEEYLRTIVAGLAETYPWPVLPLAGATAYLEEALSRSGLPNLGARSDI